MVLNYILVGCPWYVSIWGAKPRVANSALTSAQFNALPQRFSSKRKTARSQRQTNNDNDGRQPEVDFLHHWAVVWLKFCNTNLLASRHIKREKAHFHFFSHFQSTCVAQKRLCLSSNTRLNAVPVRETFKWSELLLSSPFKGKKFGLRCLAFPCNCFSFLQPILQGARASTAFARSTRGGVVGGDGAEFFAYWTQSSGRSANSSIRELKHRWRRSQRERQKNNRLRLAKQQLCTWITLFSTFLCRIKQHGV